MDKEQRLVLNREFKEILEKPDLLTRESLADLYNIVSDSMNYIDGLVDVLMDEMVQVTDLEMFVRENTTDKTSDAVVNILSKLTEEFSLDIDFAPYIADFIKPTEQIEDPVFGFISMSSKNRLLLDRVCQQDAELESMVINDAIHSYFTWVVPTKKQLRDELEGLEE